MSGLMPPLVISGAFLNLLKNISKDKIFKAVFYYVTVVTLVAVSQPSTLKTGSSGGSSRTVWSTGSSWPRKSNSQSIAFIHIIPIFEQPDRVEYWQFMAKKKEQPINCIYILHVHI